MSESYPKYQYSVFLKNGRDEQIVIRTETFNDLLEAKKDVNKILEKVEAETKQTTLPITPKCPKCGSPMVKRFKKADNTSFWGCSQFPECDGILNSKE